MKKLIILFIFIVGACVFMYPIVSNIFATTAHQKTIRTYHETITKIPKNDIDLEKDKVEKHNEELASSDLNFVDPFSEKGTKKVENEGTKSYYDALNIGPSIGIVRIPKINVELPIYHGSSEKVLSQGAGHLENSSLPSGKLGTHTVITAHRGLPTATMFRDLGDLEIGDLFFIEVLDEVIAYEVENINIVEPTETNWLKIDKEKNQATLLTCHPYMINSHRLLVTGKQVPYEPEQDKEIKNFTFLYMIGALAIILLIALLLILLVRRKSKKKKMERKVNKYE